MRRKLTDSVSIDELKSMYDSGMNQAQIAESLGVSRMTINRYLNGYCNRGRGGLYARNIPDSVINPKTKETTKDDLAEKNAANACLVVTSKEITLEGTVGKYSVFGKNRSVVIDINGDMIEVKFEFITDFIDELKAIARNVGGLDSGCEMW
jgi:predicted transcriptional regulator